jgi:uncharacterized membrane protein
VADATPPSGSALFVLAHQACAERVMAEIARFGGRVIKSKLTNEQQQALENALSAGA